MEKRELLPEPRKRSYLWIVVVSFILLITAAVAAAFVIARRNAPPQDVSVNTPEPGDPLRTASPTAVPEQTASVTPSATPAAPSYVKTTVYIDGEPSVTLSSREAAEEIIRNVENYFVSMQGIPADAVTVMNNTVEFFEADPESPAMDYDSAFAFLTGRKTPLEFVSTASFVQESVVEHEETVSYTDLLPVGYRLVKTYGMDGVLRITYSATYINGVRSELEESERVEVHPAVTGVVLIGTAEFAEGELPEVHCYADAEPLPEGFAVSSPIAGEVIALYGYFEGGFNHGIDIACSAGTVVKASASGTVAAVLERGMYGKLVEILHDDGIITRYARLGGVSVSVGDRVGAGDTIGSVASDPDGSRLHFEIRRGGYSYDPLQYITDLDKLGIEIDIDE